MLLMDARQAILVKVVPTSFHLMFLAMSVSSPQLGLLGNHALALGPHGNSRVAAVGSPLPS
jgi:hypothetical protein